MVGFGIEVLDVERQMLDIAKRHSRPFHDGQQANN
jgi:hypothetical protein